jgi:isopenicillin N synthase-like dioxygenase
VPQLIVPTIDVSGWASGDGLARADMAAEVDAAARTVGFMQIVGHGIPAQVVNGLQQSIDEFFGAPMDDKLRYRSPRPSINRGYTPPRSERLSYSLGVASPDDLFEAFNVGITAAHFPGLGLDAEIYADNIWPDCSPGFEPGIWTWFEHAAAMARTMTSVFEVALRLPQGYFTAFTDHSIDVLRVNNYQVPEGLILEPQQLGMGAHTDYGIVTILWADAVPGLQILDTSGQWHPVQPAPGALLINLGDLLARWTNDRWMSTMHRVVPPTDTTGRLVRRRSAAFFHDGNADALISTLTVCIGPDSPRRHDDVTVGEHLAQKLAGSRGLELNPHANIEAARLQTTGLQAIGIDSAKG